MGHHEKRCLFVDALIRMAYGRIAGVCPKIDPILNDSKTCFLSITCLKTRDRVQKLSEMQGAQLQAGWTPF